uniref:Uncharacterized protein n=1 Tax=Panagrolaimus superbus TaxID=310955 RepID=A0A914ZBT2_9BILA
MNQTHEVHVTEEVRTVPDHSHSNTKEEHGGMMHNIKEGVSNLVDKVTGSSEPTPKDHAKEAKKLEKKAGDVLEDTQKDFKKAQKAQEKADKEAEKANEKTAKALNKQAKGQEYLAEAGNEMIQAGAKLQHKAAAHVNEAPYNIHQKGEVHQTTAVDQHHVTTTPAGGHTVVQETHYETHH